jgi:hypothetical protein
MPSYVNGLAISPVDDTCFAVSCSPVDPVRGGVYNLTPSAFESGVQPDPLIRDLGVLDGVGVSRRGTAIATNPRTGEIFAFTTGGRRLSVNLGEFAVAMPADMNVVYPTALAGAPALLVPDISVGRPAGTGRVVVAAVRGL